VVTGSVVFASGSVCGRSETDPVGTLRVAGDVTFEDGATIALTGYTLEDLEAGIPLLTVSGTIQKADPLAVRWTARRIRTGKPYARTAERR
jgi:PAS domain-containing protein